MNESRMNRNGTATSDPIIMGIHRTMRFNLVELIREAILSKEYLPGERLLEDEISAKYGVSRTPIREAFLVLEQEGLVEIRPHYGVFVVSFSREEIIDLLRVEAAFEGVATSLAAQSITEEQITELEQLQKNIQGSSSALHDEEEFFRYDRQFHHALIVFAGSPTMVGILEKQLSQVYLCRYYTITAPDRYEHSIREHQRIIGAFKAHDPEAAERAAREHLESVIRDFMEMTDPAKDR